LYVAGGLTPVALALTGLVSWLGRPRVRSAQPLTTRPLTLPSPQREEGES